MTGPLPTLYTFCTYVKPMMHREVHNFPSLTFGLVSLQLARVPQISLQVCRRLENPGSVTPMSMALSGNTYVGIGYSKPICGLIYHPLQSEWSQPSKERIPIGKKKKILCHKKKRKKKNVKKEKKLKKIIFLCSRICGMVSPKGHIGECMCLCVHF